MKRTLLIAALVLLILAVVLGVSLSGCGQKVSVETGERVVCTYDHVVSEEIETIEVPADEADQYGVRTRTVVCEEHQRAEQLYEEAQAAIRARDLETAKEKLAAVVKIEESFRQARSQLDAINAGETPEPDDTFAGPSGGSSASAGDDEGSSGGSSSGGGGSGSAPTPGDDGKPTGPIASLLGWMPDTIKGYTAQEPIADALYMSREYAPVTTGRIESLVIAAEQFASEGAARAELDRTLKLRYSTDGKDVTVGGHKGWFGTDGRRFAVLGLTDGSVFVVLEMSSSSVDPAKLRGDLTSVAEDLPR